MINSIRHSSKFVMLALLVTIFASGCKSKKKAMEAAEKARIEQEAAARREEEQKRKDAADAADRARRDAEARQQAEASTSTPKTRLTNYFSSIASAATPAAANSSITEALTLFASPETPVLIVISESGGLKDYDKPTTISAYLNYLKDQKKNSNAISNLTTNTAGKITEVELKKN